MTRDAAGWGQVRRMRLRRALATMALLAGTLTPNAWGSAERDTAVLETTANEPIFPGPLPKELVRLSLETYFAPSADLGSADIDLIRPELRLRARLPFLANLQVAGSFSTSRYDVHGPASIFARCPSCPVPSDLHALSVGLQGGYLINSSGGYLLRPGEEWAVLAAAIGRARWQAGAFDDSLTGGGSAGVGYRLPGRIRLALGVDVESSLGGGVSVAPMFALRWDITDELRLRSRGLGLELEYWFAERYAMFATGFRSGDQFRLDAPSKLLWNDRQLAIGGGFEWKPWVSLRMAVEAGAIVSRKISVSDEDETLDSVHADPSPYIEVRVEIRH